jgi:DNA-binding NarL/FixJ family response regulator
LQAPQLPARILIVDDHPAARTTIRALLDWHSFEVCGEAKSGKEAIEKVQKLKPEIVLLDINMPEMNGIQAAYEIRHIAPSTKIVFFTVHDSPQTVIAMHVYADAFVSKSTAGTQLIPTLNRIVDLSSGNPPYPPKSRRAPRIS